MPAESWFPTIIYYEDFALSEELRSGVLAAVDERRQPEIFEELGGITASNTPNDLHLDPRVSKLFQTFQPSLESFFYDTLSLDPKRLEVFIGRAWPVIQIDNGFGGAFHFHRGATFSGVFYLKAPPGSGALEFRKPGRNLQDGLPKAKNNALNYTRTTYAAVENRLILFNSEIEHRRLANETTGVGDRIAIAFDLFTMSSLVDYESGFPSYDCLYKIA